MSAKRKRAQMEIMGLAIVFVLIIFGVLFGIRFVITKPDVDIRKGFQESTLAANMLSALRGTTTDCADATVEQLLQDCAATRALKCGQRNSCQKADLVIGQIMNLTMDQWQRDYNFSIQGPFEVSQITYGKGDCSGEKEVKIHPVPTKSGTINLKMEICS
jgi:hypothetical protein